MVNPTIKYKEDVLIVKDTELLIAFNFFMDYFYDYSFMDDQRRNLWNE